MGNCLGLDTVPELNTDISGNTSNSRCKIRCCVTYTNTGDIIDGKNDNEPAT